MLRGTKLIQLDGLTDASPEDLLSLHSLLAMDGPKSTSPPPFSCNALFGFFFSLLDLLCNKMLLAKAGGTDRDRHGNTSPIQFLHNTRHIVRIRVVRFCNWSGPSHAGNCPAHSRLNTENQNMFSWDRVWDSQATEGLVSHTLSLVVNFPEFTLEILAQRFAQCQHQGLRAYFRVVIAPVF